MKQVLLYVTSVEGLGYGGAGRAPRVAGETQAGHVRVLVGPGVGTTATAAVLQARDPGARSGKRGIGPDGPDSDPTAGHSLSNLWQQIIIVTNSVLDLTEPTHPLLALRLLGIVQSSR